MTTETSKTAENALLRTIGSAILMEVSDSEPICSIAEGIAHSVCGFLKLDIDRFRALIPVIDQATDGSLIYSHLDRDDDAEKITEAVLAHLGPLVADLEDRLLIASLTPASLCSSYTFTIAWSDEERLFIARTPDFPGIEGKYPTPEVALERAHTLVFRDLEQRAFDASAADYSARMAAWRRTEKAAAYYKSRPASATYVRGSRRLKAIES